MATCSTVINSSYTLDSNPPPELSDCAYVVLDGLEYAQLQQLLYATNNPIDYTQSASGFGVVFTTTLLFYFANFKFAQILKALNLAQRA